MHYTDPNRHIVNKSTGKVILVSVPFASYLNAGESKFIPMGIMLMGTCLSQAGYNVKVLAGSADAHYESELMDIMEDEYILFVGFSVMTSQVKESYRLTKKIKSHKPDIPIVWGGFHPIIFPQITVDNQNVDVVAYGEGIKTIVALAESFRGGTDLDGVPGIYFKRDGSTHITPTAPLAEFDDIPDINWEIIDPGILDKWINCTNELGMNTRMLPILTGIGCQFKCTFCHNAIFQSKHRIMNEERIVNNIKRLKNNYGITEILFNDEHFFGDRKRIFHFIEMMENQKLDVIFTANMRASDIRDNYLNENILKRIYSIGGHYFYIGAESGSNRILKKIKKGITIDQILNVAFMSRVTNIAFIFSFILGIPGESIDEVFNTLSLTEKLTRINPQLSIITNAFRPYPGSQLYQEALESGLNTPESLEEWTENDIFSHIVSTDYSSMTWVHDVNKFKKIMMITPILRVSHNLKKYIIKKHYISRAFPSLILIPLFWLESFRIRRRTVDYMIEAPFLRLLNYLLLNRYKLFDAIIRKRIV